MSHLNGIEHVLPEIFLLVAILIVLLTDLFLRDPSRLLTYMLTQAAIFTVISITYSDFASMDSLVIMGDVYVHDYLSSTLKITLLILTSLALVYSRKYWQDRGTCMGEFYVLVLFAVLGGMIMISGKHLLVLYLGLELMSLSLYALVAIDRSDRRATEAAMKYFVLGALASGLLLYGMSLLYGLSHALDMNTIASHVATSVFERTLLTDIPLLFALVFVVAGIAFKFGIAPFHMWTPDVYQGAPLIVTLFISSIPKLAAFALAVRLLIQGLGEATEAWGQIVLVLGLLSIVLGNLAAIAQTNLKRMFAYSTIAHMGFIFIGLVTRTGYGYSAAMFYTIIYAITVMGGFGVLILMSRNGWDAETLNDLKGLNKRSPWFAFVMLTLLLSMIGLPPLAGFYAKLAVISAVISADHIWVAGIMVFMSVIGAFYYLRAAKMMYFDAPEDHTPIQAGLDFKLALSANSLAIIVLGIFPSLLMTICMAALDVGRISV